MQIDCIEVFPVRLPLTRPMKMAGVEIRTADNLLVRLTLSTGHVGWGEAASAPTMTGETIEGMAAAVRYLVPNLTGAAAEITAVNAAMQRLLFGNPSAKCALEMALHDALARARGVPVHALLGTAQRDRLPVLWLIGTGNADEDVAEAQRKQSEGFVAFKIKVGVDDPARDAARTLRICDALPTAAMICADANQGWSVEAAIRYVQAVGSRLVFFEQPVMGDDLDGMACVAAASAIAIGIDEGAHSLADLERHHAARAATGVSLKTIKLGGLAAVMTAAALCARLGMKVNLAGKIAESGIATAALLHLAAVAPAVDWGVSPTSQYLADDVVRAPLIITQGHATVPAGHGLGVEVDEAQVRRYALRL